MEHLTLDAAGVDCELMLAARYYHLVYHDVCPRPSDFTHWMQCTVTPDEFGSHLDELRECGEIVSASQAIDELGNAPDFQRPRFVIWFDDGYQSVNEFARPECERRGVTAAVAVNSAFATQTETFWRSELSYLLQKADSLDLARALFDDEKTDVTPRDIWARSLNEFTFELRQRIGDQFRAAGEAARSALRDLFMTSQTLASLRGSGWYLANHTDSHIAITPGVEPDAVFSSFGRCADFLKEVGGAGSTWVVPFDYGAVKPTVNTMLPDLSVRCQALARAFYQGETENSFGRICVQSGSSVLDQMRKATTPPAVGNRIGKAFSRGWRRLTGGVQG